MANTAYDGWQDRDIACTDCAWHGPGIATVDGELFNQLYERECPDCGRRLLVICYASADETIQAAAAGNQYAQEQLPATLAQRARQGRWEASHLTSLDALPTLTNDVAAAIGIAPDDDANRETYLELTLNGEIVHREIGFWETTEPLARILPLLRAKYGTHLVSIDLQAAVLYLLGDSYPSFPQMQRILTDSGFTAESLPGHRALYPSIADGPTPPEP